MAVETFQASAMSSRVTPVSYDDGSHVYGGGSVEGEIQVKHEPRDSLLAQEDFYDAVSNGAMTNGATSPEAKALTAVEHHAAPTVQESTPPNGHGKTVIVRSDVVVHVRAENSALSAAQTKHNPWKYVLLYVNPRPLQLSHF